MRLAHTGSKQTFVEYEERENSERMREIDYNALLVDITDSIGVVTDAETFEILYMNKTALRTYGLSDAQDYQGRRCYELLQVADKPCKNCPIGRIPVGEMYRWEQFNQRIGRWHDNTDYIVEQNGRTLYVKIARDITQRKEEHLSLTADLTMEDTLFHCLRILSKESDTSVALQMFLETVAHFYQADRAYVFEFDLVAQTMSNTFEWCADGISAELDNLQNLPIKLVKKWIKMFERTGEFSISKLNMELNHETDEYKILSAQGIDSLMAAPLRLEDQSIRGFIGIDNPKRQIGNLQLLRSAAEFIQAELEKRKMLNEMEHLYKVDMLTGAYNRKQYAHYIEKYEPRKSESLGVVVVNINGLKDINTTYGIEYGDEVIRRVHELMCDCVHGQIFRVSGDTFVALCESIGKDRFYGFISDLRRSFSEQSDCPSSIGCAWQIGEVVPETLVKQAEELMYAEKRSYYDGILKNGSFLRRNDLAGEVLREIKQGRFVVYFQPQIDFSSGTILGAEALVRKYGEDGNLIYPDKFIPFYEAAGVIRYVDLHVLELTCAALQKWEREGLELRMSVNFSRLTLMEPQIVDTILAVCRKYQIAPSRITVEVTENINKMENSHLLQLVDQLKENRFHISLDDFGSNYSNLAVLSAISFDEVKFDRTLICDIETNAKSQVVVKNSMKMCEELEGSVSVAEGIETKEQMDLLIRFGCDIGQGYYFSRPVSQEAFSALLKEHRLYCSCVH